MKIVVDMNLSPEWVPELIQMGHDAIHWSAIGKGDDPDFKILEWARQNDHFVMTSDLDFGEMLAASGETTPSIIQLRLGRHIPRKLAGLMADALSKCNKDLARGALLSVDHKSQRLRILPLKSAAD
jgi:predicted nuclease of predicted toxin-antitoxin system